MNAPETADHQPEERPIPIIDQQLCNGCGLCVRACPNLALVLKKGKAIVAFPSSCDYTGICEAICPKQAISRLFEIFIAPKG